MGRERSPASGEARARRSAHAPRVERDGSDARPAGAPAAVPPLIRPGPGALLSTSARLALGGVLLVRTGVAGILDAAVAADATNGPNGPAVGAGAPVRPVGSTNREVRGAIGRVVGAVVGAAPAAVRQPVRHRITAWRASVVAEEERSRLVAEAALELAVGFMTDWIVDRLDVNRIVERLQLDEIIGGLELTDVILSSTGGVTGRVLDTARSRAVGADELVDRALAHLRIRPDGRRGRPDRAERADDAGITPPDQP